MQLKPFWRYYGGKYRAAPHYPPPEHGTIIEPFAGAAGYSLRFPDRRIVLVEKYPVIAELWRYLICVSSAEIRRIPCVEHVDDLPSWVPVGGRYLVGFAMNSAVASPRKTLSLGLRKLAAKGRQFGGWSDAQRDRVAYQVDRIRHWQIIEGDFERAPLADATWFVDPPYQVAGSHYVHTLAESDYTRLAGWCVRLPGQVIVCENVGATWLPFRRLGSFKAGPVNRFTREAIWTNAA